MNKDEFKKFVLELGIDISDDKISLLDKYYDLLIAWNEKINLTAITLKEQVYLKHFYDSLTLVKIIDLNKENSFCDIGTGAGFPGIVIKIFFPHLKVTLIDSLNKRVKFLELVIRELGLKDIEVIHTRAEDYSKKNREKFDVVTARAVATLPILLEYSLSLVKISKYFIAMKGKEERCDNALSLLGGRLEKSLEFLLPIENSQRTLIKIKKEKKTDIKYPRKFSDIKKRPL